MFSVLYLFVLVGYALPNWNDLKLNEFIFISMSVFIVCICLLAIKIGNEILRLKKRALFQANILLFVGSIYTHLYILFWCYLFKGREYFWKYAIECSIWLIIPFSIIFYITRPKVKEQFTWGECYLSGNLKFEYITKDEKKLRREYDKKGQLIKEEEMS